MSHEQQADRPPRSMNDLLKLSIKYHESELDRTTAPSAAQLDPERRQFLEDALRSLTTDEIENMKRSIATLQRPELDGETQAEIEEKEAALSLIHDIVDNLDNARGLLSFFSSFLFFRFQSSHLPSSLLAFIISRSADNWGLPSGDCVSQEQAQLTQVAGGRD